MFMFGNILPFIHDTFIDFHYCESTFVSGRPIFVLSQTMKFGSQQKGESHWCVNWKPLNHEFKNLQTYVFSVIHNNWYPRIKVLSQYIFEISTSVGMLYPAFPMTSDAVIWDIYEISTPWCSS